MKPCVYSEEKVCEVQAVASEGKLEMGRRPRGKEADRFHRGSVLTPRTPPGLALPAEPRMETARMATGRRVSPGRLMLRIKQTKEMDNPIVPHSLVQPNISKSDCLALLQSKTWRNQISPYLHHDLWSGKVSPSLSIRSRAHRTAAVFFFETDKHVFHLLCPFCVIAQSLSLLPGVLKAFWKLFRLSVCLSGPTTGWALPPPFLVIHAFVTVL